MDGESRGNPFLRGNFAPVRTEDDFDLPVIGALHGQVMGLGLELALSFDLRVASADCQLSIPEARVGLVADVGGTTRLARTIGPSRAKDMLLTARSVPADEALSWGLVNRVVPAEELLPAAVALAEDVMRNAPLAVGLAKLIVDQGDGVPKATLRRTAGNPDSDWGSFTYFNQCRGRGIGHSVRIDRSSGLPNFINQALPCFQSSA